MPNKTQLSFDGIPEKRRPLPRPFSFPWGDGQISEEISVRGQHHEPCIQLLQFDNGMELVRFCSYTLSGQFERNSWLASEAELTALSRKIDEMPRLRELLKTLLKEHL